MRKNECHTEKKASVDSLILAHKIIFVELLSLLNNGMVLQMRFLYFCSMCKVLLSKNKFDEHSSEAKVITPDD
jgi:hypothetical protein